MSEPRVLAKADSSEQIANGIIGGLVIGRCVRVGRRRQLFDGGGVAAENHGFQTFAFRKADVVHIGDGGGDGNAFNCGAREGLATDLDKPLVERDLLKALAAPERVDLDFGYG